MGQTRLALREFARKISQAKSPVLVLGASVDRSDAWAAAQHLPEKLKVPVWVPRETERAVSPEQHSRFQSFLPFAIKPLSDKLKGHDLMVVIGAPVFRYCPTFPTVSFPRERSLHITDDASEAARAPVGDSLRAAPVVVANEPERKS